MKLVILDRDGVINHDSPDYIKSPEEWVPIAGSLEAIADLGRQGFAICVATNQAGVGRGIYTLDTMHRINAKMVAAVRAAGGELAHIACCPHHPDDRCDCRKPGIGLLDQISRAIDAPVAGAPFVGDWITDIEAAERAGCRPILVRTGKGAEAAAQLGERRVPVFDDLAAAAAAIIAAGEPTSPWDL